MKALYLSAWFLILQTACQTGSTLENELKNEVIKVHDRIMPRTEELISAKQELSGLVSMLDSLKRSKPAADTTVIHRRADSLITRLDAADNAMSEWMYGFKTDYSGMEHEEIMLYLNEEKNKIMEIERAYDEGLQGAQAFLKNIGKK